jgi:hypothetical protein
LALNDEIGIGVRLHMLDLMSNVIDKSVSIWKFRIGFCVLDRKLSVVRKRSTIVVRSIDDLHLSEVSWYSRADVKEDETTYLWIVLSRSSP